MPTVTLAQIARFTQVERPSVSNWRRRHADFPQPAGGSPTQPLFDADAIADWLDRRPVAGHKRKADEAKTYGDVFRASLRRTGPYIPSGVDGDTFVHIGLELAAMRVAHGAPLPDDRASLARVRAEVEAANESLAGLFDHVSRRESNAMVADVNRLVSELGGAGAVNEILAAARAHGWSGAAVETADDICDLVAALAVGLLGDLDHVTIADLAAGPGRLLTRLCDAGPPRAIRYAETDPVRERWLRLRLFCHGHRSPARHPDGQDTKTFAGTDVVVVEPPFQPGEQEQHHEHPLTWATSVVECLDGDAVGFAVVPEWTLTRVAVARRLPVVWTREQLVRRGCVRAIIQLPRHLHAFGAGTDLVLLVLAPDDGDTSHDVIVCDAAAIRSRTGNSWVSDVARQVCGDGAERDAEVCRAFAVSALAGRRSLLPAHLLTPETAAEDHLVEAIRAREAATTAVAGGGDAASILQGFTLAARTSKAGHRNVGELLRAGQLVRLPGHRIPAGDLGASGQRVLGREELLGDVPIGERRIDVLTLGRHAAATITEPGDVVVIAGDRLRAFVDDAGGSVLITPVQGLRIPGYVKHSSLFRDDPQRAWIGPNALAFLLGADRNAARTGARVRAIALHELDIPMLTPAEYDQLDDAARLLFDLAEDARRQATAIDLLGRRIAAGVADGALNVRRKPVTEHATSNT